MRRLATITASVLALSVLPFSLAATATAAAPSVVKPATPTWVFIADLPDELWICQYEGNLQVESGKYQAYACEGGPPGQLALWGLTY